MFETNPVKSAVLLGAPYSDENITLIQEEVVPKPEFIAVMEILKAQIISSGNLKGKFLKRFLGRRVSLAAAVAAFQRRHSYENLYVTGEDIGIFILALLQLFRWKGRVFLVVHAANSRKRQFILGALGKTSIGWYLTVSSAQQRVLTEICRIPGERVKFFFNWVDCKYFQSHSSIRIREGEYIFSCGLENRDYATLIGAAGICAHEFLVQASGFFGGMSGSNVALPPNLKIQNERVPFAELRALYANSGLVVVPLNPVGYAAGITGLVEAMSMGKAVIVTASPGISDYLTAESLVIVPPNQPQKLAAAIEALMADPAMRLALGKRNREWIEHNASVDAYACKINNLVEDCEVRLGQSRDRSSFVVGQ